MVTSAAGEVKKDPPTRRRKVEVFNEVSLQMVEYLESLGVREVEFEEREGATPSALAQWAAATRLRLPEDLAAFLSEFDGIQLSWRSEAPTGELCTLANVRFARLAELERVPLDLDHNAPFEPAVSAALCFEAYPTVGRVALLYRDENTTSASPQVWFQDLACRWHYLAPSFTAYFRLLVVHLGISNWQYAYTDLGLDPVTRQWMALFCPDRLASSDKDGDDNNAGQKRRD